MPINLFQGADPSLVAAAGRAYAAAAPQSYARTFESVSAEYGRTMKASSDMWRQIGTAAMGSYVAQKGNYKEQQLGLKPGPELDYYRDKAEDYRKQKIATWTMKGGPLGDEAKKARREIEQKRQLLFSSVEAEGASYQVQQTLMENADPIATGPYTLEQTAAIQAYMTGEEATPLGNYVLPVEVDGKEMFKMYHNPKLIKSKELIPLGIVGPEEIGKITSFGEGDTYIETESDIGPKSKYNRQGGQPIIGNDGEEITFNISDVNRNIVRSDEGLPKAQQVATAIENILTSLSKMGDSNGDPLNKYQENQIRAGLKPLKENRAAWYADNWAGEGGKSFHKELTTPTKASANLFSQLQKIVPEGQTIDELKVLGGVDADADGLPGITVGDFQNSRNYNALTSALFNTGDKFYDPAVTGNLFEEHMMTKMNEVRTFAWETSPRNPGNITGATGTITLGSTKQSDMFEGGSDAFLSETQKSSITNIGNQMLNRKTIGTGDNSFIWDSVKETYTDAKGTVIPNKNELFKKIFGQEVKEGFKSGDFYSKITDWDGSEYLKDALKVKDDTKVKYGSGRGTQNIAPKSLLASLQSANYITGDLKTVEDLQALIGKITGDKTMREKLMTHINLNSETNIGAKHLNDMISDLIKNMGGTGKYDE